MKNRVLKLTAAIASVLALSLGLTGFKSPKLLGESAVMIDLAGDIPETVPYNPLWGLFSPAPPTILEKVMLIRKAKADKMVKTLMVAVKDNNLGMGKTQEFREAIADFRKSGKNAVCYIESEGDTDRSYYLATACDKIYVSPATFMSVNGLSNSYYFLGGLFEKAKLSIQVVKVKEYKTAGDMLFRKDMSKEHREMAESLLNSMWDQYLSGISAARSKSKDEVAKLIDQDLVLPEKFQQAGLIDGVKYLDEIIKDLKGSEKEFNVVKEREYLAVPDAAVGINKGPKVAVVFGVGNIVTEDPGGSPFMGSVMSSERMVKELEQVAKDDSVKAVIFRVDSGGGSALASDLIWRATQKVREKKPIVVSMSDVAGSGGYYVACGADAIVAQPATLTGSIGVVSAHIGTRDLLSWLKVGTVTLSKGAYAEIDGTDRPWTDAELAKSQESIEGIYQVFLDRVSSGRKKSRDEVNKIGRGRVWTGAQAKELGLVDELGGISAAEEIIKKKLGVDGVSLVYKRKPVSLWKLLFGKAEDDMISMTLGPQGIELRNLMVMRSMYKDGERLLLNPIIEVK
jgi:protease IV